jgi:hypothetical protein
MCVIVVSEKGEKVSKKDFKEMWLRNSHGWGVAYLNPTDGMIKVKKGIMSLKEAEDYYYQEVPEGVSHIMHFRLTSAGTTCPELTHPFRIDLVDTQELEYKATAVLFHNGTVSGYKSFLPAILTKLEAPEIEKLFNVKDVSDTYLMSIMVRLFSHRILKFYTSSRWAVFTIEMGSPQILLYGDFQKYKEFYVSNMSWRTPQYQYTYTTSLGYEVYSYPTTYSYSTTSTTTGGKRSKKKDKKDTPLLGNGKVNLDEEDEDEYWEKLNRELEEEERREFEYYSSKYYY